MINYKEKSKLPKQAEDNRFKQVKETAADKRAKGETKPSTDNTPTDEDTKN